MLMVQLTVIQEQVKACTKCELHKTRKNTVFSRGNPQAKLMIVGEAPGADEDEQGFPFVGKAGQLLDKTLLDLKIDLNKDIYVCNILKCRPPDNRKPTDEECNSCFPYLEEQIKLINPKVLVALGATAMDNLINTTLGITKMRGKIVKALGTQVIPIFHPSFVLRNGGFNSDSEIFKLFKQDLQLATLEKDK
jgi:uracil-DNA glycosylase